MEHNNLEKAIFYFCSLSPLEKEAIKWFFEREHILRHALKWSPLSQQEYEDNLDHAIAYKDAELLALISCQRVFSQNGYLLEQ